MVKGNLSNGFDLVKHDDGTFTVTHVEKGRTMKGDNLKDAVYKFRTHYIEPYNKRIQKGDKFSGDELIDIFQIVTAPHTGCDKGIRKFIEEDDTNIYDDAQNDGMTVQELFERLPDVMGKLQLHRYIQNGFKI